MRHSLIVPITLAVLAAPAVTAGPPEDAQAQSLRNSSQVCPSFEREQVRAGMRALSTAALQALLQQGVVLCPQPRMATPVAVVFYPDFGVVAWNPRRPESVAAMSRVMQRMTAAADYPQQTSAWDANDAPLPAGDVPPFTPRVPAMMKRGG